MKVTLDLDKLLADGSINQAEYDKLCRFSAQGTSQLSYNILVGFGVIAVSGAALALVPSALTALVLGLLIGAAGISLLKQRLEQWRVLGNICLLLGALLFGGAVIALDEGSIPSLALISLAFAGAGIVARSALLIVLSVLVLASILGASTGYESATYSLGMRKPALTIAVFIPFSLAAYQLSRRLPPEYAPLGINAARTGVFLVNFGFWIGSLWGDVLGQEGPRIPDWCFGLLWAGLLAVAGVWAWRQNRRWLVNIVATFGAFHFYTQWFERLGASPWTVMLAGLIALGIAIGLKVLNRVMTQPE